MMKLLISVLIAASALAETQTVPSQRVPDPRVAVLESRVTGLEARVAELAAMIEMLTVTPPETVTYTIAEGQSSSYSVASTLGLVVIRNGLVYSEGVDYTVSGSIVTFTGLSVPLAGDIVKFRYWIGSSE